MTDQTASIATPRGSVDFPLLDGSVGPEVVDIRKLYAKTGLFSYDAGVTSTAS
jgi:citrate synthase